MKTSYIHALPPLLSLLHIYLAFLGLYVVYLAAAFVLHESIIVKPMRLLATFVHEMSHAMATWCTGGEVSAIQVYQNEGGVTRYRGGCRCELF